MLYVGVDAHKSASQLRVVDELGEVVDRRRVASTRAALVGALEGHAGEPMKAVLEAGYGWGPRSTTGSVRWPTRSSWHTRRR